MKDVTPLLSSSPIETGDLEHNHKLIETKESENGKQKNSFSKFWLLINWRLLLDPEFLVLAIGVTLSFNCNVSYISPRSGTSRWRRASPWRRLPTS